MKNRFKTAKSWITTICMDTRYAKSKHPRKRFEDFHELLRALTIWMEFSVIPGRIQIERFIPVDCFRKKGNTFRGISYFSLFPEFPEISVPFVHTY